MMPKMTEIATFKAMMDEQEESLLLSIVFPGH
jgi:hypothetical protein